MTSRDTMSSPVVRKFPGRDDVGEHLSASTPPGAFYTDANVLREEIERFFCRAWLNIAHEAELPNPGDFVTREIGDESILVIRGTDGKVRAFYNVCRHRGTRLVADPSGTNLRSVVCPYHAWTYSTEGALVGAPHTEDLKEFSRDAYGLFPVPLETWGGFVWMNLDPDARPMRETMGGFLGDFDRFGLSNLRLARRKVYDIQANWKILVENYSECYHCAPIHPDLNRITHYMGGEVTSYFVDGNRRAEYSGSYMTFNQDFGSMTWSGYTSRPPIRGMVGEDLKRIYYYVVFPNLFWSLHPDFLMIHRTWPVTPSSSRIECEFYFDADTMARPDFDPSDAVDLWDLVNRQDWSVCERTQKGMRSRVWKGGRYSSQEPQVHDFDAYVAERLRER
jgi:Rieske 2Fe-2S family protein